MKREEKARADQKEDEKEREENKNRREKERGKLRLLLLTWEADGGCVLSECCICICTRGRSRL